MPRTKASRSKSQVESVKPALQIVTPDLLSIVHPITLEADAPDSMIESPHKSNTVKKYSQKKDEHAPPYANTMIRFIEIPFFRSNDGAPELLSPVAEPE